MTVTRATPCARVAVVVPTYQEADNIGPFLHEVRAALPGARVIVCDDSSPDGTGAIAGTVGSEIGNCEVLRRPAKQGLGSAYRHGFRVALDEEPDVIVQMDADFSHPPSMLPDMISQLDAGADVVVGSRYVPGGGTPDWPVHRRALSRYGNLYAKRILRLPVSDATSGLRAYRARCLEGIRVDTTTANGYGFMLETLRRLTGAGCRVEEVPLVFCDRIAGQSKMSIPIMVESLVLVTWWGVSLRYPRIARTFRATPPGEYLRGLAARLS